MMVATGLSKTFDGSLWQFRGVDLNLLRGGRTALIGINGAGKSTLLKCLAGLESLESGRINLEGKPRIVYVDQEPPEAGAGGGGGGAVPLTVRHLFTETLAGVDDARFRALAGYWAAMERADVDIEALTAATARMDEATAWELETKVDVITSRLSVGDLMERRMESLSGGEKKRVALAAALAQEPDVLLLDEPTNHLDWRAIEWLSEYLRSRRSASVVLVTHDRYFLEMVCNEIVELDGTAMHTYEGNYQDYLEGKAARLEAEDASLASARNKLRKEAEWVRRQPKARGTKSKARVEAYDELRSKANDQANARNARATASIQNLDAATESGMQRMGETVARFIDASLKLPPPPGPVRDGDNSVLSSGNAGTGAPLRLLSDFSYTFSRRERVGVVGKNGAGKTTLLRVLAGFQPLSSGTLQVGETVLFGYYDQRGLVDVPPKQKVLDFVIENVELGRGLREHQGTAGDARAFGGLNDGGDGSSGAASSSVVPSVNLARRMLNRFSFPSSRWNNEVARLSGGERRRLQLLSVLARGPNFLVLDEPSNDLDLQVQPPH